MPIVDTPESNPDFIQELYQNPENEVLLAEMALQTLSSAQIVALSASAAASDGLNIAQEISGRGSRFKIEPEEFEL